MAMFIIIVLPVLDFANRLKTAAAAATTVNTVSQSVEQSKVGQFTIEISSGQVASLCRSVH